MFYNVKQYFLDRIRTCAVVQDCPVKSGIMASQQLLSLCLLEFPVFLLLLPDPSCHGRTSILVCNVQFLCCSKTESTALEMLFPAMGIGMRSGSWLLVGAASAL
jgi:hypothetical protein